MLNSPVPDFNRIDNSNQNSNNSTAAVATTSNNSAQSTHLPPQPKHSPPNLQLHQHSHAQHSTIPHAQPLPPVSLPSHVYTSPLIAPQSHPHTQQQQPQQHGAPLHHAAHLPSHAHASPSLHAQQQRGSSPAKSPTHKSVVAKSESGAASSSSPLHSPPEVASSAFSAATLAVANAQMQAAVQTQIAAAIAASQRGGVGGDASNLVIPTSLHLDLAKLTASGMLNLPPGTNLGQLPLDSPFNGLHALIDASRIKNGELLCNHSADNAHQHVALARLEFKC